MADPLTAIFEQIKKYNKIIIHRHQRPDPDAIGSQVGLAEILRASFPYKQIYVVGKHIPGFDWIGEMDTIDNQIFDDALVRIQQMRHELMIGALIMGTSLLRLIITLTMNPLAILCGLNQMLLAVLK